ncbi:MAG: DUF397 domain-containing protein [Streptosporangiaceae bacterium]
MAENGIPAPQLGGIPWLKSGRSNSQGNCVELAELPDGEVAIRNSRHPDGPALVYTRQEIETFVRAAKSGDLDYLLTWPRP